MSREGAAWQPGADGAGPRSRRWEWISVGLALAAWVWAGASALGLPVLPAVRIGLYDLFGGAVLLGWAAGNAWVWSSTRWRVRRRVFFALFAGPPGLLSVISRLVPVGPGERGDLLAWLAVGVFATLFLVPVTLTRRRAS